MNFNILAKSLQENGLIKFIQLLIIAGLILGFIFDTFLMIFGLIKYPPIITIYRAWFIVGVYLVLEGIFIFKKGKLVIPAFEGIGNSPTVDLNKHKKAKYFFSALITLIGLSLIYATLKTIF